MLIYSAKKKAEASAGVGKLNDLFFICPTRERLPLNTNLVGVRSEPGFPDEPTFGLVSEAATVALEEHYQKLEQVFEQARREENAGISNDRRIFPAASNS